MQIYDPVKRVEVPIIQSLVFILCSTTRFLSVFAAMDKHGYRSRLCAFQTLQTQMMSATSTSADLHVHLQVAPAKLPPSTQLPKIAGALLFSFAFWQ